MAARTIGFLGRTLEQKDGLGVYAHYLLRELLRCDPHSHYVIFLRTDKCRDEFREFSNAETVVLPGRNRFYWDHVAVARAARRFDLDLTFSPKFTTPLFTRVPGIFVHQGSDWYVNPRNYPWWDHLYIRTMLPIYNWKAQRTVAISQATLNELTLYARLNVANSVVTHAGVASNFTPQRDAAALERFRREYALPAKYILTVARAYHGGHRRLRAYPGGNSETLIRAYQLYRSHGGELPLVVVGFRIEEYLRSVGMSDADLANVRFPGFVPNNRLHMAYQLAQCFVLATLCESFGFPILEAMASGCPAIVPSTCASPETAGGAARLADPHREEDIALGLEEVLSSQSLREEMRRKGLERARELTWQETARRTLAVFDQVVPVLFAGKESAATS